MRSIELLETIDEIGDIVDKHFSILRQLDMFYPIRHDFEEVYFHCMFLCDTDIAEADKLLEEMDPPFCLVTNTKLAIMLEQQGRIDEAIALCDWSVEHNLWDYRKNSFLDRKNRLLRKKEKSRLD
jgi:hypothetical protein